MIERPCGCWSGPVEENPDELSEYSCRVHLCAEHLEQLRTKLLRRCMAELN
jgi:hypothetical protein